MRRHVGGKKRDANEAPIVAALRSAGATVAHLSGADLPDLLIGFRGSNFLMEVKDPKRGRLSEGQQEWVKLWRGANVYLVYTPEDALEAIGVKVRRTGT